jgi:hypothetical protein
MTAIGNYKRMWNQGLQLQYMSSWWWAVCRLKHVERLRNIWIINSTTRSHLLGYSYIIWIMMHGSMNIETHLHIALSETLLGASYFVNVCILKCSFRLFDINILWVLTAYVIHLSCRSDRLSRIALLYPIISAEAIELLQRLVIAVYYVLVFCTLLQGPSSEDTFCYLFFSYVEHFIISFCKFAKCELWTRSWMICTPYPILCGWSNRDEWDGQGMWRVWGRIEVCTRWWWGSLRERSYWGDQDVYMGG